MATQTQVSGPSAEFMPYYNSLLNAGFNYANQGYQPYTGPMVANMSDIEYGALAGIQNMMGNNPILGQAQGLLSGLMGNGYGRGLMTKPGAPSSAPQGFVKPLPMSGVPSKPNRNDMIAYDTRGLSQPSGPIQSFGGGAGSGGSYDAGSDAAWQEYRAMNSPDELRTMEFQMSGINGLDRRDLDLYNRFRASGGGQGGNGQGAGSSFDPWAMSRAASSALGGGMGVPSVAGSGGSSGMGQGTPAQGGGMTAVAGSGGDMSPGNPFMSQMIGDVTNQATRAYQQATDSINNRFTNPNSFGNSRHAMMQDQANEAFARGLGGALGQLQYGAYGEGLDRQMRAAQQAQGLQQQQFSQLLQALQAGSVPRNIRQQQMNADYGQYREARDYPWQSMERLNNILAGTRSNQTSMQTPDPSRTNQLLGAGSILASLFGKPGGFSFLG